MIAPTAGQAQVEAADALQHRLAGAFTVTRRPRVPAGQPLLLTLARAAMSLGASSRRSPGTAPRDGPADAPHSAPHDAPHSPPHDAPGPPQVMHCVGFDALLPAAAGPSRPVVLSLEEPITPWQVRWMFAAAAHFPLHVVVTTQTARRRLLALGWPDGRTRVIRPGVDFKQASRPRDRATRARLGLAESDIVLLAPGPTTRHANHPLAAWAVSLLNVLDPRYRLLVAGVGASRDSLDHMHRSLIDRAVVVIASDEMANDQTTRDQIARSETDRYTTARDRNARSVIAGEETDGGRGEPPGAFSQRSKRSPSGSPASASASASARHWPSGAARGQTSRFGRHHPDEIDATPAEQTPGISAAKDAKDLNRDADTSAWQAALVHCADIALISATGPVATQPIAQCMAARLPIVATTTPQVAELVEDRHTALLVRDPSPRQLARRVLDLADDPKLRARLVDRARAEAYDFFPISRFVDEWRTLFSEVAGGK